MDKWRDCTLGDLLEVKHGFAFLGEYFGTAGSHIVLTPGNFLDDGGFKSKGAKEKWYSGSIPSDYVMKEGDLLIAMTEQAEGLLGSSAIIPHSNLYLHNQRLGLIQVRDKRSTDTRFLYYLFNYKPVRQQIRGSASGTKIRHTAPSRIAQVKVHVPPPDIQRRIAGILSAYDELIENCQRRIRILEEMARALYREWFVHFRFPGHEGSSPAGRGKGEGAQPIPRVDSPFGPIPKGWEVKKLGEIADVNRAQINARTAPDELRYIDISSVSPGQINTVTTYSFADAPGRARRIVQHGDTLWSCVRPNRRSHALLIRPLPNTIASTGFVVLTPKEVPYPFLYLVTTTDDFVSYLTNHATGAAYPAVTARTFEQAEIVVPPRPLLEAFGIVATPMAEHINRLDHKIQNLRRTRDLLLPRLLSGQVPLDVLQSKDTNCTPVVLNQ